MVKLIIKNLLPLMHMLLFTTFTTIAMETEKKVYLLFTKENDTLNKNSTEEVPWKYASQFNTIKNMVDDLGDLTNENNNIPLHMINHNAWVMLDKLINQQLPATQLSLAGLKDAIAVLHYLDPEPENIKLLFKELLKTYAHELINNKEPYKDALFNVSTLDNMLIQTLIEQLTQTTMPNIVLNLKENKDQLIQELITRFTQSGPQTNVNIKAKTHLSALAFIQMAHYLNLLLLENACTKYLGDYLSIYYTNGSPNPHAYSQRDKERNQFLNQLFALPYVIQNRIWQIFLLNALHSGDRIKQFNQFFKEQIKKICYTGPYSGIAWSPDSKYLFYKSPGNYVRKINATPPVNYVSWNIETDEKSHMASTENQLVSQGLASLLKTQYITAPSIKSPDNKYILNWDQSDNKVILLDATTDQVIETLTPPGNGDNKEAQWLWSPDNKKIAFIPIHGAITVFFIDDLVQAKKDLLTLSLPQAFFVIDLLHPQRAQQYPSPFNTWSGNKIVLNKEQEAEFALLPDALKKMFKSKIAH